MAEVTCARCGHVRDGIAAPPFRSELGDRIFDSICKVCWDEWLHQQTAIINHYGLDLRDPQARQFLTTQTETFLFGHAQA